MVDNVNNDLSTRRALARDIARELNAKDRNAGDNLIDASIWNEFVDGKGGKKVTYGITLENAEKSISTYLARNAASGDKNVTELGNAWKADLPEAKQAPAAQQPVAGQQPTVGQEQDAVTTEPRTQEEINNIEKMYENAQLKLNALKDPTTNGFMSNGYVNVTDEILKNLKQEDIAYMLKLEPNFFENVVIENFSPSDLKELLPELAKNLGIETESTDVDDLIKLIKSKAQETTVPDMPTEEEKAERKALDNEQTIQTNMASDQKGLGEIPINTWTAWSEDTLLEYFNTHGFATEGEGVNLSKLKLAIATGNIDIMVKLRDLSASDKLNLLKAMMGNNFPSDIDVDELEDKIIEVSKTYKEENDAKIARNNQAAKENLPQLNQDALDLLTRLKNDTTNVQYRQRKDSNGYTNNLVYDTVTNQAVLMKTNKDGVREYIVGTYNPETNKIDGFVRFRANGTFSYNIDGNSGYDVGYTSDDNKKYFETLRGYMNNIIAAVPKEQRDRQI